MEIKGYQTIHDLERSAWQEIIGNEFPFLDYEFLSSLERSGSTGPETGWEPLYLTLWGSHPPRLEAALLLYRKHHSYGEYIFDWDWAQGYTASGRPYYPKMVAAIPFTPATGHKLLCHPQADRATAVKRLLSAARQLTDRNGCHSLHFLFIHPTELADFLENGFLIRHTLQFHWRNRDYANFDAFLAALKRRKRKQIQLERRHIQTAPVTIHRFEGASLLPEHAAVMHGFYRATILKKRAVPYLKPAFFAMIFERMRDRILLILARSEGEWVAGALNFRKGEKLFGRYWGCHEDFRFLHFELCYYQAIDYAIEQGIRLFEAGAQGPHKIQRGFIPELTYSAHAFADPALAKAAEHYITMEKNRTWDALDQYHPHLPYRQSE